MTRPRQLLLALTVLVGAGCRQTGAERAQAVCDVGALADQAAASREAARVWTPASGRVPDLGRTVAGAIWRACPGLPGPLQVFLDRSVAHGESPELQLERRGVAVDELAEELPGHAALDGHIGLFERERVELEAAVCSDLPAVVSRVGGTSEPEQRRGLFVACDLGRFDFLSADEVVQRTRSDVIGLFVLDRWLIDHGGVPPEVAHELVRRLDLGWPPHLARAHQLLLPHGPGHVDPLPPVDTSDIFVEPDTVQLEGRLVVSLTGGVIAEEQRAGLLIRTLYEELESLHTRSTGEAGRGQITVMADRRTPWPTLLAIAYTAQLAGFTATDVAFVSPDPPLHLGVVRLGDADRDRAPVFGVHLGAHGDEVRCERLVTGVADDVKLRAALDACPWAMAEPLVVSADPEVPRHRIRAVEALARDYPHVLGVEARTPRKAASRIDVVVGAGEIVSTCDDQTRTLADVDALLADFARCSGPESGALDLRADPDVALQRVLEVAAAGRRAGKRVGLDFDQGFRGSESPPMPGSERGR